MKDIFNFKRFGAYFVYDLRNAWKSSGLSAIVIGLLPLLFYGFQTLVSSFVLSVSADPISQQALNLGFASIAFFCWFFLIMLVFPARTYGFVTDRKAGSLFLLLPASHFEKVLSMILIAGIIVPVLSGAIFVGCESLLCLIPSHGPGLLASYSNLMKETGVQMDFSPFIGVCILSFFANMLLFTLGSIYFKKSKAAKTLLVSMAISVVSYKIFGTYYDDPLQIATTASSEDILNQASSLLNSSVAGTYIYNCVLSVLLIVGIFFRIKTLKH